MRKSANIITLALLTAVAGSASADATITFRNDDETSAMKISGGKIMMEMANGPEQARMLFDGSQDGFIIINDDERSYMKFDEATLEKLTNLQERMMQQMEAQLAQVPAAQREQMKAMMKNMAGPMFSEPAERSVKMGGSDTVSGYDCQIKEIYADGELKTRQCVVDLGDIGLSAEDQSTLKGMQTYLLELVSNVPMMANSLMEFGDPGSDELPIRYQTFGMFETEGQLVSVEDGAEGDFSIPEGYREQEIPMPDM